MTWPFKKPAVAPAPKPPPPLSAEEALELHRFRAFAKALEQLVDTALQSQKPWAIELTAFEARRWVRWCRTGVAE